MKTNDSEKKEGSRSAFHHCEKQSHDSKMPTIEGVSNAPSPKNLDHNMSPNLCLDRHLVHFYEILSEPFSAPLRRRRRSER